MRPSAPNRFTTTYGAGAVVAGETSMTYVPQRWSGDGSTRAVIVAHGLLGGSLNFVPINKVLTFVRNGWVTCVADVGGPATWGNDLAQLRMGQIWAYLVSNFGVKSDKFLIYAESMGMTVSSNYTRANPTNVAAIAAGVPVVDLDDVHDFNRSGLAGSIEGAYTDLAGWNAAEPTHNPIKNLSTHNSQATPTKLWYADDDPIVMAPLVQAYDAGVGSASSVSMGNVAHSIPEEFTPDIADFLRNYIS